MKLVDDVAEQDALEELLESSKPALPDLTQALHYLLQAPFRYPPPPGGSRFRGPKDSGVFYGAETIRTWWLEVRQQGVAWRRDRGESYMFGVAHWI